MKLHKAARPRERLAQFGVGALKDHELLAILLGTGTAGKNVIELAREILKQYPGRKFLQASLAELKNKKGIGAAKACALLSAFELAQRLLAQDAASIPSIQKPGDALPHLHDIRERKKEHFVALYLNARNQLAHKEFVSIGTLNSSLVHPREVFYPALQHHAASVLLAHNHPSGDCAPSSEDIVLSKQLVAAGELLGIEVLDHLIVSPHSFLSMKEQKFL